MRILTTLDFRRTVAWMVGGAHFNPNTCLSKDCCQLLCSFRCMPVMGMIAATHVNIYQSRMGRGVIITTTCFDPSTDISTDDFYFSRFDHTDRVLCLPVNPFTTNPFSFSEHPQFLKLSTIITLHGRYGLIDFATH